MRKRNVYFISCIFLEEQEGGDGTDRLGRAWSGCSSVRNETFYGEQQGPKGKGKNSTLQDFFTDNLDRNTAGGRGGYVRTTYQETLQKLDCDE